MSWGFGIGFLFKRNGCFLGIGSIWATDQSWNSSCHSLTHSHSVTGCYFTLSFLSHSQTYILTKYTMPLSLALTPFHAKCAFHSHCSSPMPLKAFVFLSLGTTITMPVFLVLVVVAWSWSRCSMSVYVGVSDKICVCLFGLKFRSKQILHCFGLSCSGFVCSVF